MRTRLRIFPRPDGGDYPFELRELSGLWALALGPLVFGGVVYWFVCAAHFFSGDTGPIVLYPASTPPPAAAKR